MPPRPPALALALALGLAIAMSPPAASALETNVPRALAEAHFGQLYAFNMVGAYESSHREAKLRFVVARRVTPERSELLIHVRAPASVQEELPEGWRGPLGEHYALLLIHNRGRSDDLLVYLPLLLKVRRLPAPELQKQPMGRLIPVGDFRPIVSGELSYRLLPDAEIDGERHRVVEGRPIQRPIGFDRLELYFSPDAPLAVRTVFYMDGQELRRVEVDPGDVQSYGGRLLPKLTTITTPDGGVTKVRLLNALVDLLLPEEIFTEHNLRVQRFPHF